MRNKIVEKAKEYLGYKEGRNNDTIFAHGMVYLINLGVQCLFLIAPIK